jgi:hypothetical protein
MSTEPKPDGGPAFPVSLENPDVNASGMTLRDYFAAKAMQGMAAGNEWSGNLDTSSAEYLPAVARVAYAMADAMTSERGKA